MSDRETIHNLRVRVEVLSEMATDTARELRWLREAAEAVVKIAPAFQIDDLPAFRILKGVLEGKRPHLFTDDGDYHGGNS